MKTEEMKQRFEEKMLIRNEDMWHVVLTNRNGDKLTVDDLFALFQSEIKAAERRRTEEIMDAIEERAIVANKYYEEDNLNHGLKHERNALMMAVKIAREFLTKHYE